jgi:Leucine-rich repeat (LRR) protein
MMSEEEEKKRREKELSTSFIFSLKFLNKNLCLTFHQQDSPKINPNELTNNVENHVIALDISSCGLSSFPLSLIFFTHITHLNLSSNEINEIPSSIINMILLENLNLRCVFFLFLFLLFSFY